MIILREKYFNSPQRKAELANKAQEFIKSNKDLGAERLTKVINSVNKSKATVLEKGLKKITSDNKLSNKLKGQLQKARNLSNPEEAAKKVYRSYKKLKNPGTLAKNGIAYVAEKPIAAGGTVGGYVPLLFGHLVPGTTEASIAVETAVRQASPKYKQVTKKLGNTVKKSKSLKKLETLGNTAGRRAVKLIKKTLKR